MQTTTAYIETLTTREQQIANAIVRGLSNKQIAREFGISPETVKRHLASIYSKLALRGRVDLAVHMIRGSGLRVPGSESGSVRF
jgi:two-component system, NarL family, nitrate/nitrite response regulator NarL